MQTMLVGKYVKLNFQYKGDIEEVIKVCQSCVKEACKMNRVLDQNTDKDQGHIVIFVLYAEAITTAISILMQYYRADEKMPPWGPLRTRQESEYEFLCGGNPEMWGFTYGNATAFGYMGGVFVLPGEQLSQPILEISD